MTKFDFNLIVSTGRDMERHAECEIWFNLLAIDDETPIIAQGPVPGLMLVKTNKPPRAFIEHLRKAINEHNPRYCKFIKKVVPIDVVVDAELDHIIQGVKLILKHHPLTTDPTQTFRITVKHRRNKMDANDIIKNVGKLLPNPVSLKEYQWNIQIEIVKDQVGIGILSSDDYFQPVREQREILRTIPNQIEL